ncbi:MAG: hypothetical protein CG439_78, partial [Methylococcaceae bacterium NSP1-2]
MILFHYKSYHVIQNGFESQARRDPLVNAMHYFGMQLFNTFTLYFFMYIKTYHYTEKTVSEYIVVI